MSDEPLPEYVLIPIQKLSKEALNALIDEFVFREGTDYGWQEASLETKRSQVLKQLETGAAQLVYSPMSDSCTLLSARNLDQWISKSTGDER